MKILIPVVYFTLSHNFVFCQMSKNFGKCFGPSTRDLSFWLRCPSFLLSKFVSQSKLIQSVVSGPQGRKFQVPGTRFQGPGCQGPSSRVLGVRVSCLRILEPQVPDSRVSGSQVLESQCPWVPGLSVPRSQVLGSQGPRSQGLRVSGSQGPRSQDLGSQFLILDYTSLFRWRKSSLKLDYVMEWRMFLKGMSKSLKYTWWSLMYQFQKRLK